MTETRLRNCKFAFKCDKRWDDLTRTSFPQVRFCNECSRDVFLCATDAELAESVRLNRCVAIEVAQQVHVDTVTIPELMLGMPDLDDYGADR